MPNKELNEKTSVEGATEETAGRRSFMKGIVAGSVAAGVVAGTMATQANAQIPGLPKGAAVLVKPRLETAKLKISFDQKRQPELADIFKVIESIVGRTGCENCGLGGIDILLRLDELINPAAGFNAVVEGEILVR
jgi:hypothetical protein